VPSEVASALPAEIISELRELGATAGWVRIISGSEVDPEYEKRFNVGFEMWREYFGGLPKL
jgi:hypothetical protein